MGAPSAESRRWRYRIGPTGSHGPHRARPRLRILTMADCRICELQAGIASLPPRERIYVDSHWRLSHAWSSLEGWLVLCSIRHVEALDELDASESDSLGSILTATTAALRAVVGCERTYITLFAERSEFRHVHIHVVPRMSWFSEDDVGPGVFHFLNPPEAELVTAARRDGLAEQLGAHLEGAFRAV